MSEQDAPTWENTYLLGWYQDGRANLTTWDGDLPMIGCVVTGADWRGPPMWDAPVPPRAKIHPIPDDCVTLMQRQLYAESIGGVYAFGWRTAVERKPYSAV